MVWVKICGLRDAETALYAALAGADALGFVFASGRRQVTPEQVRPLLAVLPSSVLKIGVFVDAPLQKVQEIARDCRLDVVQLHGAESPAYCRAVGRRVIKAFSVGTGRLPETLADYEVEAVLLDTYVPGCAGGTGKTFDWSLVKELKCPQRIILAGGLNAANVQKAIRIVRPYGVDVSSGVETNGQKDKEKIWEFIKKAKEV